MAKEQMTLQRAEDLSAAFTARKRWWEGASIYHIYVRSFADSNGDGIGDLRGVLGRVDYLRWLGVDAIWLSPTMPSPNADWGYDVSDYRSVHEDLGSLEDLAELVEACHQAGIRVLLDLVPNHTSSEHPWFLEAKKGPASAFRDFYVWADPKQDGSPPNNWLTPSGEPAWSFDPPSGQYYLHNFLPGQPDLNWWNPKVREMFLDILHYWFERGIDGFRVDVAHGLYKDAELRDNPPAPAELSSLSHGGQLATYSANRPEVHSVYRNWRLLARAWEPEKLFLGETWVFDYASWAKYFGNDDELQLCFNFPFVYASFEAASLAERAQAVFDSLPPAAWPVWVASNHDVGRFPSRWCGSDPRKVKAALVVLAMLPGSLVLYYGDEIGMTDVEVPPSQMRDPMYGGEASRSRDRCRTPMQWEAAPNGGFCAPEAKPWLPLGNYRATNVAEQREDPSSILNLTRQLLGLRRSVGPIPSSSYLELHRSKQAWVFEAASIQVAINLTSEPAEVPYAASSVLLSTARDRDGLELVPGRPTVHLEPWEAIVGT
jgi:alpha-glucosidase